MHFKIKGGELQLKVRLLIRLSKMEWIYLEVVISVPGND